MSALPLDLSTSLFLRLLIAKFLVGSDARFLASELFFVYMGEVKWFVAFVRSCQERKIAERLGEQGVEVYVPVQKVERKWSDRIKVVDKLIFPRMIFIHCDEKTRGKTFDMVYGITSYMMDSTSGVRTILTVPERQMTDFRRVVAAMNGEDLEFVDYHIDKGDTVRIIRGPLKDFTCECVEVQNKHKIVIRLGMLGSLLATVSVSDVIKE